MVAGPTVSVAVAEHMQVAIAVDRQRDVLVVIVTADVTNFTRAGQSTCFMIEIGDVVSQRVARPVRSPIHKESAVNLRRINRKRRRLVRVRA